ncbi:MAG: ester cyclase [Actinomycetota bacterium]|nr:ester cyclase [Actinomycetota bacterium]
MRDAFPDARFRIVNEIAEGDTVVVHYEMTGTQEKEFLGIPPSGNQVTFDGVDIIRVVDGRARSTGVGTAPGSSWSAARRRRSRIRTA